MYDSISISKDPKTIVEDRSKYRCYFGGSGRLIFINNEDLDNAIKNEKKLLVVCRSDCFFIGADRVTDLGGDGKVGYSLYCIDVKDTEISDFSNISKLIVTDGEPVYLNDGSIADGYFCNTFFSTLSIGIEEFAKKFGDSETITEDYRDYANGVDLQSTAKAIIRSKDGIAKLKCLSGFVEFREIAKYI